MSLHVDTLLDEAKSWFGYLEKKSNAQLDEFKENVGYNNFTIFWKDLKPSFQGQPWCQCFVNYCFNKTFGTSTAKKLLYTPGDWSYYTPTSAGYFKKNNAYSKTPHVGDLIFFKNATRIHHVGIVTKVTGTYVYTIEGNTSSGPSVIPNGGGVYEKRYLKTNPNIDGYGTPNWDAVDYKYETLGWNKDAAGWWYADTHNSYKHDVWAVINGCKYYFDSKGYAVKGFQEIDGKRYFFEPGEGAPKECALMTTEPETGDPTSIGSLVIAYFN